MARKITVKGSNSWPSGPLLAGPMVGEVRTTEAWVWVQGRRDTTLTLHVDGVGHFTATPALPYGCVTFHVFGLQPDTRYQYSIEELVEDPPVTRVIHTAPRPSAKRARICFGSCFAVDDATPALPILDAIADQRPNLFIMTGDNCYYHSRDLTDKDAMVKRQLSARNNASLRRLFNQVPVVAIWDDHDYGDDNSDYRYLLDGAENTDVTRQDALGVFRTVWAQSHHGGAVPGIYSTIHLGPLDVFLTDGRYHRIKDPTADQRKQVLGPDQLAWLKNALKHSSAAVKVVVSGSTVLSQFVAHIHPPAGWEGWEIDGQDEREDLLAYIEHERITGVVFVAGDLHTGYVYHRAGTTRDGESGPTFWEVVSSPLEHGAWNERKIAVASKQKYWDKGVYSEVHERNFGVIDVDLDRQGAEVKLQLRDVAGDVKFTRPVALETLARHTPSAPKLSAVGWTKRHAYFFRGGRFLRYTTGDPGHIRSADFTTPRKITDDWPGLAVEAGIVASSTRGYVFNGNGYHRLTLTSAGGWSANAGYPTYIARNWHGFWTHDLDAAMRWPGDGRFYFFRDDECIAVVSGEYKPAPGYPKKIKARWPSLPPAFQAGIDAVVVWSPEKAYFFKGDRYVRLTITSERLDRGYPADIAPAFPDLASL